MSTVARPVFLPLGSPSQWGARLRAVPGAAPRLLPGGARLALEPERLLAVERGAAAWRIVSPDGRPGILGMLGPGSLVPGGPDGWRPEALALVPAAVLVVRADAFEAACRFDGILAAGTAESLRRTNELLVRRLAEVLTLRVADRLALLLRDLAAAYGTPCRGGHRIDLPLSQDLIAALVGATRESVNRGLGELRAAGSVERRGATYVVLDADEEGPPSPLSDGSRA